MVHGLHNSIMNERSLIMENIFTGTIKNERLSTMKIRSRKRKVKNNSHDKGESI